MDKGTLLELARLRARCRRLLLQLRVGRTPSLDRLTRDELRTVVMVLTILVAATEAEGPPE